MTLDDIAFELTPEQISESKILVVDDEEIITSTLASFLFVELDAEAVTFNEPEKAVAWLQRNDVDLVISDFLMPGLDGIKLLAAARAIHPHSPRILLTGYADKENAIKAINEVGLYQYIEKPWSNEDLRIILRNGVEKKQLLEKLRQKMSEVTRAYDELLGIQKEVLKAFV